MYVAVALASAFQEACLPWSIRYLSLQESSARFSPFGQVHLDMAPKSQIKVLQRNQVPLGVILYHTGNVPPVFQNDYNYQWPKYREVRYAYLRIMKLILLICVRSRGLASGFSFPLYIGLKSFHLICNISPLDENGSLAWKSYSQLIVLCSLPFGLFSNTSSFNIKV